MSLNEFPCSRLWIIAGLIGISVTRHESASLNSDEAATTTTRMTPEALEYDTCGKLEMSHSKRRKRIVGGIITSLEFWPWLVRFKSLLASHVCSGTVIAQRWVVTAAHCFKQDYSGIHILRLGILKINQPHCGVSRVLMTVGGGIAAMSILIISYPGYRTLQHATLANETLYARYIHDIALVRLSQDTLTEPICLPLSNDEDFVRDRSGDTSEDTSDDYTDEDDDKGNNNADYMDVSESRARYNIIPAMTVENNEESDTSEEQTMIPSQDSSCWVVGWGVTQETTSIDQILHEVPGDVIGSKQCSDLWGEHLETDMLCFGDGTYGPCLGDSGGPLSCERNGVHYLVGVVSWGTEECNVFGYPSVFTNIKPYLTWIYEHMNIHM